MNKVICTRCREQFNLRNNVKDKYEVDSLCGNCRHKVNKQKDRSIVTCKRCDRSFELRVTGKEQYKKDGLCGKCRGSLRQTNEYNHVEVVSCSRCNTEFKLQENVVSKYRKDGLCGRCRGRRFFLDNLDKYRKTKFCPDCGKIILITSNFCNSCSQTKKRNHRYKDGSKSYNRFCKDCGKRISTTSSGKCSDCYKKTFVGNGNPNYKFGHYIGNHHCTKKYKKWRSFIYGRDNYTCKMCGKSESGNLNGHHILPQRDFPNLVYEVTNGVTLCRDCHQLTFNKEYDYVSIFLNEEQLSYLEEANKGELHEQY